MDICQSTAGVGAHQVTIEPEAPQRWDFVNSNHDEVLALLKPSGDRKYVIILVGGALLVGLGLGWTFAANSALFNVTQMETPARRFPEIKSSGKSDGLRRTAGAPYGKLEATAPAAARPFADAASAPLASQITAPTAREPIAMLPETKPTT